MSLPTIQDMHISTAERLEFEAIKSEKLQYFLVNSLKTINDLENQLRESRIETIAARNEVNFLKLEANANKRKMTSKTFPSSSSVQPNTDTADYSSDDEEMPPKQKHIQQRKFVPVPSCSAASQMMPFNSRVEKAIDSVAESLVNPHANTPPKSFLFKFVCRIFDGGDLYYGYIVAFNRLHFQVYISLMQQLVAALTDI
jgi:hypothetical protein